MYRIRYDPDMKPIIWHPKAKDALSEFPESVRNEIGYLLFHAFKKKTQKTPQDEIQIGKKRLTELLED